MTDPISIDTLYQTYNRSLYRSDNSGSSSTDPTNLNSQLLASNMADNSSSVEVSLDALGNGVSTSTTVMASAATQVGMNTPNDGNTGFWLGTVNGVPQFSIGNPTNYLFWNGTTLTILGGVSVSSLNIPDTTTASSFHVDSSGNTWWGANVASGYVNASASILATGLATFKNILVGGSTIQYQTNDNGIGTFGDGSDGAGAADGSTSLSGASLAGSTYTLTRDVYFTDLVVSTGVTIIPAGYRIFGKGVLSLNGTAVIQRNGNNGSNGQPVIASNNTPKAGGAGGATLSDGYLKGTDAGTNGGASQLSSSAGTNKTNSIGVGGVIGGNGGNGGFTGGGGGGVAGTVTASNVKFIANWHLQTLRDVSSSGSTVKFDASANSTGGGGGGSDSNAETGAGGGGAGSAGGILAIYFRSISIGASSSITANGGNGGNGGALGPSGKAGGGGGGGSGGIVVLVYNILTNSGTVTASGGNGGTGANNGTNGNVGLIKQFQLSM